ncbi:hypothetical protein B6D60_10070 [candidate division KSB1 bacterium 4484_87]|nr:MAG: hypothetical protein B6D60_10070 [candidate division KSB1 bacterium 4484_87]
MFAKNQRPRQFNYVPRFYHPVEEDEANEPRIKFRRLLPRKTVPKRSPIMLIVMILILIFLIRYLGNLTETKQRNEQMQDIKIEIID